MVKFKLLARNDVYMVCVPSMAQLLSSREISLIIQRVQVHCVHSIDAHQQAARLLGVT